ncbi:methyltransferase domain-containing protein [Streptomyces sp. NA02950]|uniref:methyltransferase domain-containing protein n=1 Tax=Streptomyces sp. NA02950 TaxID=2742137 RepID=UPI00158FCFAF|nr:methyltransferase domain-containing protein [Streptomyces sp. NA02950]QKV92994.1 methyltransferase domain-containing protein [Streptomyces sp. NA02950]
MAGNEPGGFVPLDELTGPRPTLAVETAVPAAVPIEITVKERYDTLAQAGTSNLCCAPQAIYTPDQLDGIPQWVLDLSSGCGAPLGAIDLRPGQAVADFGCGAGLDLILAARRVGPGGRVIGIDGSLSMVRTARRAAKETGHTNIDVRVGDIRRPPLRPSSVDVLLSNCVLGMFPDKAQVLEAISEALRPGGYAVISDVVYLDEVPEGAVTTGEADADDYARCVVGMTTDQYREMVVSAGFDHVDIRDDGSVAYRDGARVTSATIVAYRGQPPETPCC